MAIKRYIGIDFGTSTSLIRVKSYKDNKPVGSRLDTKQVVFGGGQPIVPTIIKTKDDYSYYGHDAKREIAGSEAHINFKMDLESTDRKKRKKARQLTEQFLKYLGDQYAIQRDGGHFDEVESEEHTLISYPVKWSDETKEFMIAAAKKAGFKNVKGMDEASAAIHSVTIQSEEYLRRQQYIANDTPVNILLVDMGAGTTDLVVCRHIPGERPENEILCTWPGRGGETFGGREIEELLREYIKSKLPPERAESIMKRIGTEKFKMWKENTVSPALRRNEIVSEFADLDIILDLLEEEIDDYSFDRAGFESMAKDYLGQFSRLIDGCIKASGLDGSDIDLVITTGGHSQWYFIDGMIRSKSLLKKINEDRGRIIPVPRPHETVALGLVYSPMSNVSENKLVVVPPRVDDGKKTEGETEGTHQDTKFPPDINRLGVTVYYKEEFTEIRKSGEAYKGKFNMTAFIFPFIWMLWYNYYVQFLVYLLIAVFFIVPTFGFSYLAVMLVCGFRASWIMYNKHVKNRTVFF